MAGLDIEPIPALADNYIFLAHDAATGCTAAVDPGAAEPVLAALDRRGWRLTHILATHHHGDHTGGILDLVHATGCQVVGARADAARIPGLGVEVAEGDSFLLGSAAAMVMEVPGHTLGHVAYWFPDSAALFCGDTLFSLGCGRLFEGSAAQMWASLAKLRGLPADTRVYCAHEYTAANGRFARVVERGNAELQAMVERAARLRAAGRPTIPSTLGEECAANPFLRADHPALARAVGLPDAADPVAVFAELRRRKDVF